MPTILVTDSNAKQQSVSFKAGDTLMEVLHDQGYDEIAAICGGCCSCATCHLLISASPVDLPEVEADEEMLLELADGYDPLRSRLSCQIELDEAHDGLQVILLAKE